jgi:preprotein translocase subunit SecG
MENIIIAVHVLAAVSIIGLILLQQGKGAEMGASFGSGSSQALFGPQGTGTIFSRATAILTAIFFATSLGLAIYAKHKITGTLVEGIPSAEVIQSANEPASDVPAATESAPAAPAESDIPK